MTVRNLTHLTAPKSVALIGASPQPGSVGLTVTRNLLAGNFSRRHQPDQSKVFRDRRPPLFCVGERSSRSA